MNRLPSEPLSPEERALADQLARLGPHGEPPAALDARILAAAHDAVAGTSTPPIRRRPRWPLGVGLAASTLLAVGIAWQLRPPATVESQQEPVEARMAGETPPPPMQSEFPPSRPEPSGDASANAMAPPAQANADLAAAEEPAALESPPVRTRTRPDPSLAATSPQAPASPAQTRAMDVPTAFPAAAPPPPAPPAAPSSAPALAQDAIKGPGYLANSVKLDPEESREEFREVGRVADQQTMAAIAARREQERFDQARALSADTQAVHRKESQKATRASRVAAEMADDVPASPRAVMAAPAPGGGNSVRDTLKRTDLQLPVVEDGKLEPDDWLERIRLRRDLGDRASAGESLRRFKQTHPFQKIPDDLQELLAP